MERKLTIINGGPQSVAVAPLPYAPGLKPGWQNVCDEVAAENQAAAQSELSVARQYELAEMTDDDVVAHLAAAEEELLHLKEVLGSVILAAKQEIERRIRASGGRAMAHPKFEIEIVEEFSPYAYDFDLLNAAAAMLPDDERAKVIKHVPEYTQIIAAHDEAGNPVSIAALRRKYGEDSEVGILLRDAMKREKTGERLKIKERKAALPPGGSAR